MPGTLYIVATPIGNLKDFTPRAAEVLRSVDVIACEDTRHTQKLLTHFRISTRTVSYHEHNENERAEELLDRLVAGESVAIVSDAGTPGISDPGFRITSLAHEAGVQVISIPGPSALVTSLVASGIASDSFFFGGFLPAKRGERVKRLGELKVIPATLVIYEAPHRLKKCLADCLEVLGDRPAAVSRELTKIHEETTKANLSELIEKFADETVRGEIVLVIEHAANEARTVRAHGSVSERVNELVAEGMDRRAALKATAKEFGLSKSDAYRAIQNDKS